jgi:sugar/nucleoside kinase (ribokinase family)
MTVQTDIMGMGAALVDVLAEVDESFLEAHKLTKGHMHLIDAAQAQVLNAQMDQSRMVSGGSAGNTVVGYALFGGAQAGKAAFAGCTANDALGRVFAKSITAAGVNYISLPSTGTAATGICYALITPDGERTMCTYLGASGEFDMTAITSSVVGAIESTRLLFLEGYIWDTPARAAAADHAITIAKERGRQVGFTLSDGWVVDKHHATFMRYLNAGAVDVLFANEAEAMALTKEDNFAGAVGQIRTLAKTVVLTRSEKGALVLQGNVTAEIPSVPVPRVVDATGAGDMFAAGFLYGYLNDMPLGTAGSLGARAASEVISHIGARPHADIQTFLPK